MSKIICFVVLAPACLVARSELPVERNGRVLLPPAGGRSLDVGEGEIIRGGLTSANRKLGQRSSEGPEFGSQVIQAQYSSVKPAESKSGELGFVYVFTSSFGRFRYDAF